MKYEEYINNINPKPKFNLDWYTNEDKYSDGDVENLIIDLLANNSPEEYPKAIANHPNWPTYYHLSHIRQNILNWYPFSEGSSVLEIGCGFGAITQVLCDNCKKVTAVELSKRRAAGALLRCRDKENLEIIVGNLNDIEFKEKFDYITLIGVLEYQGTYTNSDNPYKDFLTKVKGLLKPQGRLLIAIENQYGLKYWCGIKEDHTGVPFDGINNYVFSANNGIRTFSRAGLNKLILDSGFKKTFFYYPMPDYKFPTAVYSEKQLPQNGDLNGIKYYYTDTSTMVGYEKHIYQNLIDNNVFEFFANSFLVECADEGELGEVTFSISTGLRLPEYRMITRFTNLGTVEKFPLISGKCDAHINSMLDNEDALAKRGLKVLQSTLYGESLITPKVDMPTLYDIVLEAVANKDKDKFLSVMDMVYADIEKSAELIAPEENIIYTMKEDLSPTPDNIHKFGKILKTGYIDMTLNNAFYNDGDIIWFDQEWILENVPISFVMYRTIRQLFGSHKQVLELITLEEIAQRYNVYAPWEDYNWLEYLFIASVFDSEYLKVSDSFCDADISTCVAPLKRLLGR